MSSLNVRLITEEMQSPSRVALFLNIFFVVLSYMTEPDITPCTIGIPHFVISSNMFSYVYRNMRLGFYQDYSTPTSAINKALQNPGQPQQQHHAIAFRNPTTSANQAGGDPEAGDLRGDGLGPHVKEVEVISRSENLNPEGDQTEKAVKV